MAADVEQPFLPTTAVPDYAGTSASGGASRRRRFMDRNGRFQQSHGSYKCVGGLLVCIACMYERALSDMTVCLYVCASNSVKRSGGDWRQIYYEDVFNTVIHTKTSRIVTGIFVLVRTIPSLVNQCEEGDLTNPTV